MKRPYSLIASSSSSSSNPPHTPTLDASSSSSSSNPPHTPTLDASSSSSSNPPHTPTLDASSSSSSKPRNNYDVFLSFTIRGGTWKTFTGHLYSALDLKGIYTFLDVKRLERGEDISPGLDNAIKSSRYAVVVLSEKYTSSHWCMDELVQILKCRNDSNINQIVLPIFYHVNPDDIRKEAGGIWEGFQSLQQEFPIGKANNQEKVESWRDALKQLHGIAGYSVDNNCTDESKFIEDFIKEVSRKFFDAALSNISKDLVGMDSRLEKLDSCVFRCSPDGDVRVRFIGICGMGGLGKTTLAGAYYKRFVDQFDASSFIENVRDACKKHNGLVKLQKQLLTSILNEKHTICNVHQGKEMIKKRLCRKKVLVILDDVNQLNQLEGLAEKNDWFGYGSRIIITTRNESLLSMYQKEEYIIHKVDELNYNEALQLFSSKAFKSDCQPENYRELYKKVIEYASGLPLALVVLGSFLPGKTMEQWKSALERLKKHPEKGIMEVLRISFDGLGITEKNIFLDIACFFNGFPKDCVMKIMNRCGFFPEIGIRSLVDKSLLHMDHDKNILQMHDLLEEMGKEIVREESREPGRRSRIWLRDDFIHVMNKETGTDAVEAIVCPGIKPESNFTLRGFSKLKNLRLLIIYGTDSMSSQRNRCSDSEGHGLVELILIGSSVIERLRVNPTMEQPLSASQQIIKSENFSLFPNLKKLILNWCEHLEVVPSIKVQLILDWCDHLEKIEPSIKLLKRLTLLGLEYCKRLRSLPTSTASGKSLKVLILDADSIHRDVPEGLVCSNEVTGKSFSRRTKSF